MDGMVGFEPTIRGPKPLALPLGYIPAYFNGCAGRIRTLRPLGYEPSVLDH